MKQLDFNLNDIRNSVPDVGASMDVISDGTFLYAIQNGSQYPKGRVCKISSDGRIVREFAGIGNARQIAVSQGILVITAREDGLWLLSADDLSLLSHFQTIEFATGITLSGGFAFVSERQFGVEVIDIKDPRAPVHIGLIRVGEVQSACVWNGYLFGGIWGEMCVAVIDIHDLSAPKIITKIALSGRGDGVSVRDGILYAAIGQHRRGIKNIADKNDPYFGKGNGFEVFDVRNLQKITKIVTKFTDDGYHPAFDTWKTYLSGDVLILTNSICGLYAYHIGDFTPLYHIPMGTVGGKPDAVTGAAVLDGKLYFSTGRNGLYLLNDPKPYVNIDTPCDFAPTISSPRSFQCDSDRLLQVFSSDGAPVLGVCRFGELFALASGIGGIQLVDDGMRLVETVPTSGFSAAVAVSGKHLFSAESSGGLSVYERRNGKTARVSTLCFDAPITQLTVSSDGRYVLLGAGSKAIYAVDVSDADNPKITAERRAKEGPLYGENFASHYLSDGRTLLFWHRDGLVWFDPKSPESFGEIFYKRHTRFMGFGPENGIDTDGKRILFNLNGSLIDLPLSEGVFADDLERIVPEVPICGKFICHQNKIYACERAKGEISVTDIADPYAPKSILKIRTNASCGKPVEIDGKIYIPAAYAGLLLVDLREI